MRTGSIARETRETNISLKLSLDGQGKYAVETPVSFLNHMLELFSFHSGIDMELRASGDIEVDFHHTVEDIGICLGLVLREALGSKKGINRYGFFVLPMDEARAEAALDISGRPFYHYSGPELKGKTGDFDVELVEEFFRAVTVNAGLTLHLTVATGENLHHIIEAMFKAFARAFKIAATVNEGSDLVPSSKGVLD